MEERRGVAIIYYRFCYRKQALPPFVSTVFLLYSKMKTLFHRMFNGDCGYPDVQSTVRVRAAAALGAMLQLVHERQSIPLYSRNVLLKIEEGVLYGSVYMGFWGVWESSFGCYFICQN